MNFSEFFAMNGRAFYVWGSFGAFAIALTVEVVLLRLRAKKAATAAADAAAAQQ